MLKHQLAVIRLEEAELTSSAMERGHGEKHHSRKREASALKGSPEGCLSLRLEKPSRATNSLSRNTFQRSICMQSISAASLASRTCRMGKEKIRQKIVLQRSAATGPKKVHRKLYCMLHCRDSAMKSTNEMARVKGDRK